MSHRARLRAGLVALVVAGALGAPTPDTAPAAAATSGLQRDFVRIEAPIGRYLPDDKGEIFGPLSSPAVGDVTGDGVLDLVHGAPNGFLYIFRSTDGALQRTILVGDGMLVSSPTMTDLDNDGRLDIVVGLMPTRIAPGVPTVFGFDGANGRTIFARSTCAFGAANCDVFTTIVAADLNGDNDEELILVSQNERLQAWRGDGSDFFAPLHVLDTTRGSPAVGDLDGDGRPEIVIVTDLDTDTCRFGGTVLQGPPGRGCLPGEVGSMIWIVNADGTVRNRRFLQREVSFSTPSIGDINGDGRNDIVIGSGTFYAVVNPGSTGGDERAVTALDAGLNILPGWPVRLDSRSFSSPALVDVDGDASREVAIMDSSGRLYLIGGDGAIRWQECARDAIPGCGPTAGVANDGATGIDGSPVAADVDNDGEQEIVTLGERTLQVRDARTGSIEASDNLQQNPEQLTNQVATPVIYADPSGATRIAAHVLWDPDRNGRGPGDAEGIVQWSTGAQLGRADWPAFKGDARTRSGFRGIAGPPAPPPAPPPSACPTAPPTPFLDIVGLACDRRADVDRIVGLGISRGITASTFGTSLAVSRAQIATFVARTIAITTAPTLPVMASPRFTDDAPPHEIAIDQLAAIGVIADNGESGASYFPTATMRRDEMASYLVRAYAYITGVALPPGPDAFGDIDGNPHETAIEALVAAGVVQGTTATTYNPAGGVSRLQMASLLARLIVTLEAQGAL